MDSVPPAAPRLCPSQSRTSTGHAPSVAAALWHFAAVSQKTTVWQSGILILVYELQMQAGTE